ncbi:uncharacterized protein LOC135084531 [Ostrinia nubilalis]|uniref:uncharacterized protein LOC135084531 n=1 Tax=Ostrinia nubilalis TaxID=29057 RepID=UPI0030824C8C
MMLTIHGLPLGCKYHDLKSLIKQECNLSDFILDNLVGDGDASKKVRIGVADESEGSYLIKCLDGYRMGGNVLRVVPVAKPLMSQAPNNFDQRGGYPPRNDMPNQHNNYGNQSMAPMGGRPSPWAQNTNQWSSNQPTGSQRPTHNFGYQQQTNQPFQQQQQPSPQLRGDPKPFPQRDMRNRMPQDQSGYGFNQKNSAPEPNRRMLRNVDLVPSGGRGDPPRPVQHPLLPSQNQASDRFHGDKPLPINKDYFHGPNQFGNSQQGGPPSHFQSSNQNTPSWGQQMPPQKQPSFGNKLPFEEERKYPPSNKRPDAEKPDTNIRNTSAYKSFLNATSGRPVSPHGRRVSPSGRRVSPSGRRISPSGRRISPSGRRISPHAGRVLPDGRRISPHPRPGSPGRMPDRRLSPGRRVSPSGRRMSPGRRISPARRLPGRASPQGGRKMSPHKRFSPSRRLESPPRRDGGRRESPARHGPRFSPNRRPGDKMDKFPDSRAAKQVRPAYEPEASNQAMYSGGYRPNIHENVQYPVAGARQADQRGSWQQDRDKAMFASHMKKQDEERREGRPIVPPRGPEAVVEPKRASPLRKSRSPRRDARDRSPLRDRYRRHSPSPRSPRSPRRSWALEKRRSPEIADAPPPPVWPGQNPDEPFPRPSFPEKDDPKKHPTWDRRPFDEPDEALRRDRDRRPAPEARPFTEPAPAIRIRTDLVSREPMPAARVEPRFKPVGERYSPKLPEPRFEPREEYKPDYRRPDNGPERKNYPAREEFRDFPRGDDRDNRRRDDFPRREEFPRRDDRKEPFPRRDERPDQRRDHDMFQKEFEDIYKRAKEFKQKVEEMRRPDHNRDDFREDRHRDLERADDRRKMLEDHRREMRDEARQDYRHPDLDRHRPEDRHRLDDRPRSRQSDEFARHRDVDWKDDKPKPVKPMSAESLAKREKAAEEIASKILERHGNFGMSPEVRNRIMVELKNVVTGMINHMFGYKDVSFIETVIKFNAKHNDRDEYKIFQNVMGNFPNLPKTTKRHAEDDSEIPAKTSRRSPENLKQDVSSTIIPEQQNWDFNVANQQSLISNMMMQQMLMNQAPMMVPNPFGVEMAPVPTFIPPQPVVDDSIEDGYNLYLCKEDFKPFTDIQADFLKNYLVQQLVAVSENYQGWAPDITLKGLQSQFRYQVHTRDAVSKEWLLTLDFSEFKLFDVLVYTKEELWYERAAIWLPGHSRCRNIEPLKKLELQNKKLEGADIGKWKMVKKIVNIKGTRVYVDMPPSSARVLEKHKMLLSYELQKVSVYLRAVAVDKDAFDSGLREPSVTDKSEIVAAAQNSSMPSLGSDPSIVKVTLKGSKSLSIVQARKIKESIIYNLFKYHQSGGGLSRTDFVKYGFCTPNCFGVVPENEESKRWLMGLDMGRLNKQPVVVVGADEARIRFFKMTINVPNEHNINAPRICERLRQSNQGVKGLNFHLWKPASSISFDKHKALLDVEIDAESVETLLGMKFRLDYVDDRQVMLVAYFKSEYSSGRLREILDKYKAEQTDSYDVANMDISQSESDDDIIYMGEL